MRRTVPAGGSNRFAVVSADGIGNHGIPPCFFYEKYVIIETEYHAVPPMIHYNVEEA
jgi:hypothetical protein